MADSQEPEKRKSDNAAGIEEVLPPAGQPSTDPASKLQEAIREAQRRAAAAGLASSQAAGTATLNMNSKMAPTAAKRKMLWGKAPAQTKQWDGVALEGDDSGERKNKFLKLMGGLKKGVASVDSPPAAQVAVEVAAEPCRQPVNNTAILNALEQQYEAGRAYQFDRGMRGRGLGFGGFSSSDKEGQS